ncbi:hypothetical protein, variant [Aphanomyces astaci]|uniref:Uncharacterized protein n=1 Tax=Aphanomyces astaci TaxID=112090 RepID=W4GQH6_APHAT|nr:hypothetical protein, variant [Aphanomyces astaci]ETV81561.1 hypothetical protein, variant [Aphanomyces astaci]RQM26956.1 hypothetical protein B5M09_010058 [Aphanomyces astaci]|eukprot:XP_009829419.1 hypothetical protein, variant [Aphanomyces astaci]
MEDLDDEPSLHADENGLINLSQGAWVRLDEVIWSQGDRLLTLIVEANQLVELPAALGNLALLRVLNVAHNKLTSIPDEIGQCAQLLELNAQHNFIKAVPKEKLLLSYNNLKTLPREMHKLHEIHTIDVRFNQLTTLPETLSECPNLTTLACEGNNDLVQIPESLRDNSRLVLWILQRLREHAAEIKYITDINNNLEQAARLADDEKLKLKEEILRLERDKQLLWSERPVHYLKLKGHVKNAAAKTAKTTSEVCLLM